MPYRLAPGEGAFYGPKIDIHVKDAIGRQWQMGTVQLDFNNPQLFDLTYVSPGNKLEQPYMVHCAKAGSLERFIGIMVEHYAGAFPAWLAPVQVTVAPVADRHLDYAEEVAAAFTSAGLRVEVDRSSETVGDKIRRAITQKHPSVVVVGDRDIEDRTVGLRLYGEERDTRGVALDEAVARIAELAKEPE